jgi:hypothetical protein
MTCEGFFKDNHKWSKWSDPLVGTAHYVWDVWADKPVRTWIQRRVCKVCNKHELREVC